MNLKVINHSLYVGSIEMTAVASSSVFQIGDTEQYSLYSMFDTPPESVVVGPIAPLGPPEDADEAEGESSVSLASNEAITVNR
ncbi:spore germination protein PD [Paenibacillus methanolicus]|uniref:Spore germination protein PD n=1 Tax=Paenibacillus methanolicus TaxID=582686 RepID=A0A5S5BZV9_9BACL|nr:spore germination protein PD [Paenibacillus methanolicus]